MNIPRPLLALSLCLVVCSGPALAQIRNPIREDNIRAELGFLASDAMQGRGSGTNFERIAAESIGSQFRQFGLEPAGDTDSAGKKGFVPHVSISSVTMTEGLAL